MVKDNPGTSYLFIKAPARLSTVLIFAGKKPAGTGSFAFGGFVQELIAIVTAHRKSR
jgi:hypothetical protein